jgi:hypothetical protein
MTEYDRARTFGEFSIMKVRQGLADDAGFYARAASTAAGKCVRRAGSPIPGQNSGLAEKVEAAGTAEVKP